MLHKTSGIVLHITKYSESSLIVKIYTQHFGLQSYIINGVRSKKSKNKANIFQPLALVDLIVTHSETKNLQRITEINLQHHYSTIPFNIAKSTIAMFLNEVLYKSIKETHSDENLFSFIKSSLLILDLNEDNCSNFHLYFLTQLSRYLGFYPEGKHSEENSYFNLQEGSFVKQIPIHSFYLKENLSKLLNEIIDSSYETIHTLKIQKQERKELLQTLILYYKLHIPTFSEIKSIAVLEEINS